MILLVGPSACGKTEVAKLLTFKYGIKKVVTHTTRTIRVNEKPDVDYHFVTKEQFIALKNQNGFVETTIYNDNFYGPSKREVADDKVLIVDTNGLVTFRGLRNPRIVTFFMAASEETRYKRMIARGDSIDNAKTRIEHDRSFFNAEKVGKTDFCIDTEKLTIQQVTDLVYKQYTDRLIELTF